MPRITPEARAYRTELMRHLHHMHGGYSAEAGDNINLEGLETIHRIMHIDLHACPPHEHTKMEAYSLGKIKYTLGRKYIDRIKKEVSGQ